MYARENCFDLIITDMQMPHKDGEELINDLEEVCPECDRIVFSGQTTEETYKRILPKILMYIPKPTSLEQLKDMLIEKLGNQH